MRKSKCNELSIADKQKLIRDHSENHLSQRDLAKKYHVGKTTVKRILDKKTKYLEKGSHYNLNKRSRLEVLRYEDVDEQLFRWFCIARKKSVPISGPILQAKALQIATHVYGPNTFVASQGWLEKFTERHCICYKALSGEGAAVAEQTVAKWVQSLPTIYEGYAAADIFNLDETGLFYQALPKRSFALKSDKCIGGKNSKVRLTVCLITSMTGEKLDPIIIGNAMRPRVFGRMDVERTFNVRWRYNKTSWMTGNIFREYVTQLDKSMRRSNRKIILFLDNATCHPDLHFENVKLAFLPPNTTTHTQPLDAGIIQSCKLQYRKLLLNHLVDFIDNCIEKPEVPAPKITQLDAVTWIRGAWDAVKASTISKCFRKVGFNVESEVFIGNTQEPDQPDVFTVRNLTDEELNIYVTVDDDIGKLFT